MISILDYTRRARVARRTYCVDLVRVWLVLDRNAGNFYSSSKKSNVRVWLIFGSLFDHPRQVYYSWSDTFLDPKSCKILHLEHFWITQDRFTVPEATHFGVQNDAQFFIWTTFESSKTGLLFLKRHIFGSENQNNLIFVTFLNIFWVAKIKFTVPEATQFWVQNWEWGTLAKIVIPRSRLRNRVKCLIPKPGRCTHRHTHTSRTWIFWESPHNRPFGQ